MLGLCDAELLTECEFCDLCPQYAHLAKWKTYTSTTTFDLTRGFNHLIYYCDMLIQEGLHSMMEENDEVGV